MFQSNKGQTSIEFIILIAILLLIGLYFVGSIYKTFDSNFAIYKIKNKTLQLLSEQDSGDILYKVNYQIVDSNLNLDLLLINSEYDSNLTIDDYAMDINEIIKRTSFENVTLTFSYTE